MTDEQSQHKRMEGYFRDLLRVDCDIGVYIDLAQAIRDFLLWMKSNQYARGTIELYRPVLNQFLRFIGDGKFSWDDIFTHTTLNEFKKLKGVKETVAVRGLWRHLFLKKTIRTPLRKEKPPLPEVYEHYLLYRQKTGQAPLRKVNQIRSVLSAFHNYLQKHKTRLSAVRIEHIDGFLGDFTASFAPNTRRIYRSYLRGFLRYLYEQCGILHKDLAPLVVGPPLFAQPKPPKFLRPHEVTKLFDSLNLSSAKDLRNYAMVHLAYYLGLRPAEISLITLDDISFGKSELAVKNRKNTQEVTLPLPESVRKAIAAYIVGARPESHHRRLFLTLCAPCRPMSANIVAYCITVCMKQAGLSATAYWLRHTYAQNLLETGASIYEIKEMLGHNSIETSQKYLHIHVKLMRKVLFDEEL